MIGQIWWKAFFVETTLHKLKVLRQYFTNILGKILTLSACIGCLAFTKAVWVAVTTIVTTSFELAVSMALQPKEPARPTTLAGIAFKVTHAHFVNLSSTVAIWIFLISALGTLGAVRAMKWGIAIFTHSRFFIAGATVEATTPRAVKSKLTERSEGVGIFTVTGTRPIVTGSIHAIAVFVAKKVLLCFIHQAAINSSKRRSASAFSIQSAHTSIQATVDVAVQELFTGHSRYPRISRAFTEDSVISAGSAVLAFTAVFETPKKTQAQLVSPGQVAPADAGLSVAFTISKARPAKIIAAAKGLALLALVLIVAVTFARGFITNSSHSTKSIVFHHA